MRWPQKPDESALQAIAAGMNAGVPVVIEGPPGIGKTSLLRAGLATTRRTGRWVIGSESVSATPLAALAVCVSTSIRDAPGALVAIRDELAGGNDVLAIDDAQFLDAASAAVLASAIATRVGNRPISVLVTHRSGRPLPHPLSQALADRSAITVTVPPLGFADSTTLIEKYLGGPVSVVAAQRFHATAQGNPYYLRLLVRGSRYSGQLAPGPDGRWVLSSEGLLSDELRTSTKLALDSAGSEIRELLRDLSLMSPLTLTMLESLGHQSSTIRGPRSSWPSPTTAASTQAIRCSSRSHANRWG